MMLSSISISISLLMNLNLISTSVVATTPCCYRYGFGALMKPCCLKIEDCNSEAFQKALEESQAGHLLGGGIGKSLTNGCPANADEAAEWSNSSSSKSAQSSILKKTESTKSESTSSSSSESSKSESESSWFYDIFTMDNPQFFYICINIATMITFISLICLTCYVCGFRNGPGQRFNNLFNNRFRIFGGGSGTTTETLLETGPESARE